ncbi:MAG TPA: OPT/YSL family transporter, partial [Gemmatimonadales bacterium]|nr:OPT/YSL family transporter [Gemmatimonadales bacterium]
IAVGVYLPISTSAPMFIGGAVRWMVERRLRSGARSIAEVESGPGVLFSSGLIAGGAIAGIVIAGIAALMVTRADAAGVPAAEYLAHWVGWQQTLGGFATSNLVALVMFGLLGYSLYRVASR